MFPFGNSMGDLPDISGGIGRRGFIRNALLAIGVAGVPLPAFELLAATGGPRFFDDDRFAMLDALADTIMPRTDTPGARDVDVAERIDTVMHTWASAQTQTDFTRVLDELAAAGNVTCGMGLPSMNATQQLEVVAAFDAAHARDPGYAKLKGLVLAFYYLSQAGATQELRYQHVPGAWEPNNPVTADTRAWAFDVGV